MRVNMIDEATLATMLGAFLWLVYHCREWKKERSEFAQWADSRAGVIGQIAGDVQEVLEDILDGLTNGPTPAGNPHPSNPFIELLTATIMNKTSLPFDHASTQETQRALSEEKPNPSSIEIQESD